MTLHRPPIFIVGAGIVGSAIAYNLAIRGAEVVLLDEGSTPGSGVTSRAFGWINVINGVPGDPSYALWIEAMAEYRHLSAALPHSLASARRGSLLWEATAQETERFADLHRNAGENIELLKREAIGKLEPRLRLVPECAVLSRDDLALDPRQLAETFVAAAVAAGASAHFDQKLTTIETGDGRVTGIRISDDSLEADAVILAAGGGIRTLTDRLGLDIGITTSPALLLRYSCSVPIINRILRSPRLEIRQANDGTLVVAESYVKDDDVENSPQAIGKRVLAVMRDELELPDDVALKCAVVGDRPIFPDGLPRVGFVPDISGLYIAAGHPGVILAPLIGRLVAEEILDGRRTDQIPRPH